ncbi:MAG: hypothetical protein QM808_08390 [Steroidobacteraceae bacterium]
MKINCAVPSPRKRRASWRNKVFDDFLQAKRKAAERLQLASTTGLPSNSEIEAALLEHQRLFQDGHHTQLQDLRNAALQLMRVLGKFNPRLVGGLLNGAATAHTEINLHVFADWAEQVAIRLEERGIKHRHAEKKFRYEPTRQVSYPSFKFIAGQHAFEVVVFPIDGLRQAPSSPVDGQPMERADLAEVEKLVE